MVDVGAYGWHIFKSSVSWLPWSHLSIFSTQEIAYTSFWDTSLSNSLTLKKILQFVSMNTKYLFFFVRLKSITDLAVVLWVFYLVLWWFDVFSFQLVNYQSVGFIVFETLTVLCGVSTWTQAMDWPEDQHCNTWSHAAKMAKNLFVAADWWKLGAFHQPACHFGNNLCSLDFSLWQQHAELHRFFPQHLTKTHHNETSPLRVHLMRV